MAETIKPSLPKGVRDFSPEELAKRTFVFQTLENIFLLHGFQALETPAVENLNTLTGKYGDEGDKLIFKVLNSGDYLSKAPEDLLQSKNSQKLTSHIADRALRYDLTIPFARYVAMNRHLINFPFKRYQIQNVWRADRPQKGRYREFYQCDCDVIGSSSLFNEAELISIYISGMLALGIQDFTVQVNNRKVLQGICRIIDAENLFMPITICIDKLDKIGWEGVGTQLEAVGLNKAQIEKLQSLLGASKGYSINESLRSELNKDEIGKLGLAEIDCCFQYLEKIISKDGLKYVSFDASLARGLDYYTGCVFEVKPADGGGSLGGGGRYDDLTGIFGLKDITGVGISFGADRIYDLLLERDAFPKDLSFAPKVLIANFDEESEAQALGILKLLRKQNISVSFYPETDKLKKNMNYADKLGVNYIVIIGESERKEGVFTLKNMLSGDQSVLNEAELLDKLKN